MYVCVRVRERDRERESKGEIALAYKRQITSVCVYVQNKSITPCHATNSTACSLDSGLTFRIQIDAHRRKLCRRRRPLRSHACTHTLSLTHARMYARIHTSMHTPSHPLTHTHTHTEIHTHTYTSLSLSLSLSLDLTHTHKHTHKNTHFHALIHTHTPMHTFTHTHTHPEHTRFSLKRSHSCPQLLCTVAPFNVLAVRYFVVAGQVCTCL